MSTLFKTIGTLILALFATLASSSAMAQYHGHGGYGHGGGVRFGISLGVPLYGPGFYPAPYYGYGYGYPAYRYPAPAYAYPPVVVESAPPPVYVERAPVQEAPAPSLAQKDWYYCAASNAYYPYVAECATGWQRVPALPPSR